ENGAGPVLAWRQTRSGRWPAYGLNASFAVSRPAHWQRAVFLDAAGQPIGVVADEVNLLGRGDMHVAPYRPRGAPPTRFAHLFIAAGADRDRPPYVIDPRSLAGSLRS